VYTDDNIQRFDADYQKQLLFNFCATRATKKKSVLINKARAMRLCDIDLNVTPKTFSRDTTDRHKLSRCVLEGVLTYSIGCRSIVCIRAGADRNPTKRLYSDQAKQFSDRRKENNINTESWEMSCDHFFVMQGTINWVTLFNELRLNNLSKSHFKKYHDNMSGDIGIAFDSCKSILSIPWHDIIHYSHVVMIFGKPFDQSCPWGPVFQFKNNPQYPHHVF
jgi:hypothetical protein